MQNKALIVLGIIGLMYTLAEPVRPVAAKATASTAVGAAIDYGNEDCENGVCQVTPITGIGDINASQPSAFSDVKPDIAKAPVGSARPSDTQTELLPVEIEQHVFPVTSHNSSGCAVSVAPDKLLSVHHVVRYNSAQVQAGNSTLTAEVSHPPGADDIAHDGAYLKIPGGTFPAMKIRAPFYYEPVTLYGLRTKTRQRGFVSSYRTVSLVPEANGVESGDSGGAIVGDDGCLVGLISGIENPIQQGIPKNKRIVTFTRMDYMGAYLPKEMRATPDDAKSSTIPEPIGNVTPTTTQNDWPVNNNQPVQSTNRTGVTYSYQWRTTPRRRLFH